MSLMRNKKALFSVVNISRFNRCQSERMFLMSFSGCPSDNTVLVGKKFPLAVPFSFIH